MIAACSVVVVVVVAIKFERDIVISGTAHAASGEQPCPASQNSSIANLMYTEQIPFSGAINDSKYLISSSNLSKNLLPEAP